MTSDRVPEVSVIVTAWNTARWIDDCLHSIYASSFDDIEIVLHDDGSSDGTGKLAAAWEQRD